MLSYRRAITISPWWLTIGAIVVLALVSLVSRQGGSPRAAAQPQLPKTAVVQFIHGAVQVSRFYAPQTPVTLNKGMVIYSTDRILTPQGASCELTFQDGGQVVKVHSGTEVRVETIEPSLLGLDQGKLSCLVARLGPGSSFSVKTPTAVFGVRGTGWEVEVTAEASTAAVFEGTVQVEAPQKPQPKLDLVAGQKIVVDTSSHPTFVAAVTEQEIEAWAQWKGEVEYHEVGDLVVAEFDQESDQTDLGTPFGVWNPFPQDASQGVTNQFNEEHWGDAGLGMQIRYDVASPNPAYGGFWINLDVRDLHPYNTLVFWIKGDRDEGFPKAIKVELKNAPEGEEVQAGVHFITGLTSEWQEFVIPFEQFQGLEHYERMLELVFTVSDITAGDKEGAFYLDHISFTRRE